MELTMGPFKPEDEKPRELKLNKQMKRLGSRRYNLIKQAVNTLGTFNPDEILGLFGEQLYGTEVDTIILFLKWVHEDETNRAFGSGNYEQRFLQFLTQYKA